MVSLLLPVIYLAFISLGLPGFSARLCVAGHVPGAWNFCFRSRYHFHDYLCRNNCFQSEQ